VSTLHPPSSGTPKTLPEFAPTILRGVRHLVDGKYRLEERLGEGALGVVHRAVHLGLEKSFTIKLLKTGDAPSAAALARFQKEALALGRLQHPSIVQVTDSGIDEAGVPYLVMELLAGAPLSEICRQQSPLPLARALSLLEEIASGIDAAHDSGVLLRDLKPGNVLVASAGARGVKVLDFGLAELLAEPGETEELAESPPEVAATGALHGTPLYAAPELIRQEEASRASDIYSFGVLAYELLGRPGTAGEVVRRLREGMARAEAGKWPEADAAYKDSLSALEQKPAYPAAAQFLREWGEPSKGALTGTWQWTGFRRPWRAAQVDQIRRKSGSSHPFYWAAFQLNGDWN